MNEAIERVLQEMASAWDAHDMQRFGEVFAVDADFVNIFGDWLRGREQIVNDHRARHETMFRNAHLAIEKPLIRELNPDLALVHWRWRMHDVRGPAGEMADKTGLMLQVFERRDHRWRIVASHNTETRA